MEAALDLESSAFGLGGSTPLAPTKNVPAWRNGKTRRTQNAVSSDVGVRCPRPAPMQLNTDSWPSGLRHRTANAERPKGAMSSNLILSAICLSTSLEGAAGVAGNWS